MRGGFNDLIGSKGRGGAIGARRNTVKSFGEKVEDTLCSINDLISTASKQKGGAKNQSGGLRAKLRGKNSAQE